jgi:uncharacterized protein YajQ (UPF0234 family)
MATFAKVIVKKKPKQPLLGVQQKNVLFASLFKRFMEVNKRYKFSTVEILAISKQITKIIREELPRVKPQIQGEAVRVSSSSKDELQQVMQILNAHDFDFPISYTNYR